MTTKNPTRRLAISYLAVIMTMSLLFSAIIFGVTTAQLGRPLPPRNGFQQQMTIPADAQERIDARDAQTRESIIVSLVALNIAMLGIGTFFSYYLARRTLHPIEKAMQAQGQFVSDASHELRTPLTALQTTNEVALRKKHIDDAVARDVLTKNINEVGKLRVLSEALLTLTHAVHRPLQTAPIWIDDLAQEIISGMFEVAASKHIRIETHVKHEEVTADVVALGQVLTILFDNAIKYSPEASTVTISSHQNNDGLILEVTDQGIGIETKDQAHIFDRFYRADSARTRGTNTGHGLGLAIAQSLCARQGFTLVLKRSSPQGSTFAITIPS